MKTGVGSHCDVSWPSGEIERLPANGCVVVTGCAVIERPITGGRVSLAGGLAKERKHTRGRVLTPIRAV